MDLFHAHPATGHPPLAADAGTAYEEEEDGAARSAFSPRPTMLFGAAVGDGESSQAKNRRRSPMRYGWWDDGDSSDTTSTTSDSLSSYAGGESEDEEEEDHPLGFDDPLGLRFGVTRFFLQFPSQQPETKAVLCRKEEEDEELWHDSEDGNYSLTPLRSSVVFSPVVPMEARMSALGSPAGSVSRLRTAPPHVLLSHHLHRSITERDGSHDGNYERMLSGIEERLAALIGPEEEKVMKQLEGESLMDSDMAEAASSLHRLAKAAGRADEKVKRFMKEKRERLRMEHLQEEASLKALIERDEITAQKILDREEAMRQQVVKERKAEEQRRRKEREQREREEERKLREQKQLEKERDLQLQKQREAEEAERRVREEEEARARAPPEHVVRSMKMISKLLELRPKIEPFEKSKEVSRRRLQMKKLVRGRLNTLTHDPTKLRSVAAELVAAVAREREEDEQAKQQAAAAGVTSTPDGARGRWYLLDLISSNVIIRAQADGFGSARGDGFPLANTMALVAVEVKELAWLVAAHIYAVCPIAMPYLPKPSEDSSESELMESIGMKKLKGSEEFETFEHFLQRTEGLISVAAAMMCSRPEGQPMMGGHKGAVNWLKRFLDALPKAPVKPLPLITAPVLVAFLTGAGHMLARKYPREFRQLLSIVVGNVIPRLDEGDIGAPSSVRLKKTVKDGYEGFESTLPTGAIPELYENGEDPPPMGLGDNTALPATFGQAPTQTLPTNMQSTSIGNPFSGAVSSGGAPAFAQPNPFGQQPQTVMADNPFTSSPAPFGAPLNQNQPAQQQSTPFGMPNNQPQQQQTTPFGSTQKQEFAPFGGQSQQPGTGVPNPFGVASTGASGLGQVQQSPFGMPTGEGAKNNPFGGIGGTSFGGSVFSVGEAGAKTEKERRPQCKFFAQGTCRSGANCKFSHDTPSRGGGGGKPPCRFFAQGKCREGAKCAFSHDTTTGAGGSDAAPQGFGHNRNASMVGSPFGGGPRR